MYLLYQKVTNYSRKYCGAYRQTVGLLTARHHLTILIKQLKPFQMPAAPVHNLTGAAVLFLCQFCLQQDANLDSLDEARSLMIPAEPTHRVDDPIHLPQLHAIHQAVELIEIFLYLPVIIWIAFVVAFVEHGQRGLTIPIIRYMRIIIDYQFLKIRFFYIQINES